VNGNKLSADGATVAPSDALEAGYFPVRKGGRDVALARLGPA